MFDLSRVGRVQKNRRRRRRADRRVRRMNLSAYGFRLQTARPIRNGMLGAGRGAHPTGPGHPTLRRPAWRTFALSGLWLARARQTSGANEPYFTWQLDGTGSSMRRG